LRPFPQEPQVAVPAAATEAAAEAAEPDVPAFAEVFGDGCPDGTSAPEAAEPCAAEASEASPPGDTRNENDMIDDCLETLEVAAALDTAMVKLEIYGEDVQFSVDATVELWLLTTDAGADISNTRRIIQAACAIWVLKWFFEGDCLAHQYQIQACGPP